MFKNRSLKFKLIGIITSMLVVLGFTVFCVLRSVAAHNQEVAATMIESTADSLDEAIAAQFFERYGDVQAFAINPDVQSGKREVIEAALNGYSGLYLIYDLIVVADTQGRVIAITTKDPSGKDINVSEVVGSSVADKDWFQKTLKGEFTADKDKGFNGTYVEDIHVDELVSKVYGEKRIGNSFNAQVKNARGEVIGVISNRAGARWYEGELLISYSKLKESGYESAHIQILNKNGIIAAELDPATSKDGKEVSRDYSRLLSKNYMEANTQFAVGLSKGEKGHYYSFDEEKDAKYGYGYAPLYSHKFVNSIGWSSVVKIAEKDVMEATKKLEWFAYSALALIFALSQAVGWYFSSSLSRFFSDLSSQLLQNTGGVNTVAKKLSESSNSLSSATTEQAAALQETVSAIDEVSAMVGKNADNAKKSQEVSSDSAASAEKGKQAVDQMIQAITDINQSNQEIMKEIENSNAEIKNIVNVISEIGNKTKVINDIVFQTKLLSFNASVEAARAGEHGKGFAVVAEEVGNLAQMSGNAAKEISDMLGNSIKKVESIVQNSQGRIQALVGQAREKVEHGTVTAKNCGEVLEEVVHSVATVNQMLSEIATASREQSQGVNEINKAMNQMDQVTQTNASIAQESAHSAQTLENQCEQLKTMVHELLYTVEGRNNKGTSAEVVQLPSSKRGEKAA